MNNYVNLYARISSESQNYKSIKNQFDSMKIFCQENNLKIKNNFHEICSAYSIDGQNVLKELLKFMANGTVKTLLCLNISRFSRNILEGCQMLKFAYDNKINIIFIEEQLSSNIFENHNKIRIGISNAMRESEIKSQNIKENNYKKQMMGWRFGNPKYGETVSHLNNVRVFVPNENEKNIIKFINNARDGVCTCKKLNEILNKIIPDNNSPIEFIDTNGKLINKFSKKNTLNFKEIAYLLNQYDINNRGKKWNCKSVAKIYNNK